MGAAVLAEYATASSTVVSFAEPREGSATVKRVASVCVAIGLPQRAGNENSEMLAVLPAGRTEGEGEGCDETAVERVVCCGGGGEGGGRDRKSVV